MNRLAIGAMKESSFTLPLLPNQPLAPCITTFPANVAGRERVSW